MNEYKIHVRSASQWTVLMNMYKMGRTYRPLLMSDGDDDRVQGGDRNMETSGKADSGRNFFSPDAFYAERGMEMNFPAMVTV